MISIGDFARLGRVSVRMLRHYDTIGLLRPEYVDPGSGYRYYRPGQLGRLNRIVALKDLGLRLDQVRAARARHVPGRGGRGAGLERVEIPAAEVASAIHRGPIEGVDAAYQLLHTWVRDHGLTDTGRGREVYLECPDDTSEWITEVQVEFTR